MFVMSFGLGAVGGLNEGEKVVFHHGSSVITPGTRIGPRGIQSPLSRPHHL